MIPAIGSGGSAAGATAVSSRMARMECAWGVLEGARDREHVSEFSILAPMLQQGQVGTQPDGKSESCKSGDRR